MDVAVIQCYFLSRITDEEGRTIKGYRKPVYDTQKSKCGLKATKQRLFNQTLIIWVNGWLTECRIYVLECNQERIVARNAGINDRNIGSDNNN